MQANIHSLIYKNQTAERCNSYWLRLLKVTLAPGFRHAEIHAKADGSLVTDVDLDVQRCIIQWLSLA